MSGAWSGPPGKAGWYAQQDPDGAKTHPDDEHEGRAAGRQWAETHPGVLRRLLARWRR